MAIDIATKNKMLIEINQKPEDIITAVQNDTNSRYLDVFLYDNGTPIDLTGCEVKIFMKKPESGDEIWNDGAITNATAGRCEFLFTTQSLAEIGNMEVQISIWQDNTFILSTEIFTVYVTPSLLGNSSVESSNEYGTLVVLFQNLYQALYLMETMVSSFGSAGSVAESISVTTFWQMLEAVYEVNADALANASVQGVLDILGLTGDTGGSTTAGTTMAKLNALLSRSPSAVKSVQHGTIAFTAKITTQTISAVDVTRAVVLNTGSSYDNGSNGTNHPAYWDSRLTLKDATTVEAEVCFYNSPFNPKVSYAVIEFY